MPSPQVVSHSEVKLERVVHVYPVSIMHPELHPSLSSVFPSSHFSELTKLC